MRQLSANKYLVKLSLAGIWCFLSFSIASCSKDTPSDQTNVEASTSAPPLGTLVKVKGEVLVNGQPGIQSGHTLHAGDRVTALKDSFAELRIQNGAQLRVGPESSLDLKKPKDKLTFKLLVGKIYASLDKGKDAFDVQTHNAVAGIRGTRFYVEIKEGQTYTCVCEGTVAVKGKGDQEEVLVQKGEDQYVGKDGVGLKPTPSPSMVDMINPIFSDFAPEQH